MAAFERSLVIAAASSVLATSVALPIAYAQWKLGSRLAKGLAVLGGVPFLLPPVIISVLFLLFWGALKHVGQIENTIISHAVTFLALPLVLITLGFSSIDRELVEAAETMGARESRHLADGGVPDRPALHRLEHDLRGHSQPQRIRDRLHGRGLHRRDAAR